MIFTGILSDVTHVFVGFAGDEDPIFAKHVFVRGEFPLLAEQSFYDMHHERHPARRGFDKTKLELWKLFWNFIGDQIAKREQRLHAAVTKSMVSFHIEEI